MLEDISIKDFALIDSASIEFGKGFTVLSGETGAGKSLLIGALTFLLGGRSSASQVRPGAREASVSGTFFLGRRSGREVFEEPSDAYEWLSMHGIEAEDERILLRRTLKESGSTKNWIGDTPVTRQELSEFCSFLVDIHGQHEHQNLMKVAEHRKYLDSYAGIEERVRNFTALYSALTKKREELESLVSQSRDRKERMDLLNFAVREIEEAKLKAGEDRELDEEEARLSSFEKLFSDIQGINSLFSAGEGEGVVPLLKKIRAAAARTISLDKKLSELSQRLESAFYEITDIADEFDAYERNLVFDPARLSQVQERQSLIYTLKKKYAGGVNAPLEEVFSYLEDARGQLSALGGNEESQSRLRAEIAEIEKKVYAEAKEISKARRGASERMSRAVEDVLSKLGMANARFSVRLTGKEETETLQKVGPYGMDDIEFLISANPGQPLAPLAKIASGGELSRVMLSLKTILADSDTVGTMIFDEIDTGIGGEVAVSVGSHLKALAQSRQVLCITHLASIAVYADNQIKIRKEVSGGTTRTSAVEISGEERVAEIARMLSGDSFSEESLEHARSMLEKFSFG